MELVSPACFQSLPLNERWQQIYLALGGTDDCLSGAPILEVQRAILALLGSEECIHTPEDFWRVWAANLDIECVESAIDAQRQIYGYYGGDEACFDGFGPDGQMLALFEAVSSGSTPTGTLERTGSGLLFFDGFTTDTGWSDPDNRFAVTSAFPVSIQNPNDFLPIDSPPNSTIREVRVTVLGENSMEMSADVGYTTYWWATRWTTTDNWVTNTAHGEIDFPNPNGHNTIGSGQVWQEGSTFYRWALTSDVFGSGVPGSPYLNALYSGPSIDGPWTLVHENPPLGTPGSGYDATNTVYQVFPNPGGSGFVAASAVGDATFPGTYATGSFTNPTAEGSSWTISDADILPPTVDNLDNGWSENTMFAENSFMGGWLGYTNELRTAPVVGLASVGSGGYFAETFPDFSTDVRHVSLIYAGEDTGIIDSFITPGGLILNLDKSVAVESDGSMGAMIAGNPSGGTTTPNHLGHQPIFTQLEPCPWGLRRSDTSDAVSFITIPQPEADFICEYVIETHNGTQTSLMDFVWDKTGNSYHEALIDLFLGVTGLYKVVAGVETQVEIGPDIPPPFEADSVNQHHRRCKVSVSGNNISFWVNNQLLLEGASTPVGGSEWGFRSYRGPNMVRNMSAYSSDSVTVSGLEAGDVVSLHGAGRLPAAVETAVGESVQLSHSHFPLKGIQVKRGETVRYFSRVGPDADDWVWGGDTYQFSIS